MKGLWFALAVLGGGGCGLLGLKVWGAALTVQSLDFGVWGCKAAGLELGRVRC